MNQGLIPFSPFDCKIIMFTFSIKPGGDCVVYCFIFSIEQLKFISISHSLVSQPFFYSGVPLQLLIMKTIGDYEYKSINLLGEGSFGKVYAGRKKPKPKSCLLPTCVFFNLFEDESNKVAIKKIKKSNELKQDDGGRSFRSEAKALIELKWFSSENIVQLYYFEQKDDSFYFIMEYCNRGNLHDYSKRKGCLSEAMMKSLVKQIANGMKALFYAGIVHRDLKPLNILLHKQKNRASGTYEKGIVFKIADFGLALLTDHQIVKKKSSRAGTHGYKAPEILSSTKNVTKCDLWSIGVIFYKCWAGEHPFKNMKKEYPYYVDKNS